MMSINSKDAILQTAYTLFSLHGFSGTSIKMIANQLEISTSLIFHHFKSKEALWVEVERFAIGQKSLSPVRDDSLEHFLTDLIEARIEWYRDEKFRNLFRWRSLEKNVQDLVAIQLESPNKALSVLNVPDYIKKAQEKGLIKTELDPQVVATLVFSISSYAIWDYVTYYSMNETQLKDFKALAIQALINSFEP